MNLEMECSNATPYTHKRGCEKKVETSRIWVAPIYLCKFIFKKFHRHIYINLTTLLKNLNDPSFLLDTLPNHR